METELMHQLRSQIDKELAVKTIFDLSELIKEWDQELLNDKTLTEKQADWMKNKINYFISYNRNTRKGLAEHGIFLIGSCIFK